MSIGFDTLRAAEVLTQAGIADTHAKAIVSTMSNAVGEQVATKTDITGVQGEIAGVKTSLAALKSDIAAVRTDVAELKAALTWRIVLALGVFAALTRMMP